MSLYTKILEEIILPIGDRLMGSTYSRSLKEVRRIVNLDEESLKELQRKNLENTLEFALKNSQYYKNLNIQGNADSAYNIIKKFPILEKSILRENMAEILSHSPEGLIKNSTSGSSGFQTTVYVSKEEQSFYRAIQTTWWEWAGFVQGKPILQTGLSTKRSFEKRIKDYLFQTKYLFAFGLNSENTREAFQWAKNKKPFLGGYASSLYVLAQIAETQNEKVKFKSAISWGDKLFDHYKTKIEKVFDCRIYETYGASEGLMIASQKDLEYMYIMSPYIYLEILDDNGNEVNDGEMGHIVVTSLIHKSMPLIRYRLGDLGIKLPQSKYPSKRDLSLPILQKVIGRETDIIRTPKGKKLIVHSFTGIFEYFPEISQFCVVQEQIDGIRIQYIRSESFKLEVLDAIKKQLSELINEPFSMEFESVESIASTGSGKPQIVISKLKN
jgi:phenylacetate-CoA ligase